MKYNYKSNKIMLSDINEIGNEIEVLDYTKGTQINYNFNNNIALKILTIFRYKLNPIKTLLKCFKKILDMM